MVKNWEKPQSSRRKFVTYKEKSHKAIRKKFKLKLYRSKIMKEVIQSAQRKNFQPRILYQARFSFWIKEMIKSFLEKQKFKKFIID